MPSRKNVWRRRGRFEFRRETSRLSDKTPWGDTLWVRSIARHRERGRAVTYCSDRKEGRGAELGLGVYHKLGSRRDAVACAKQMRGALLSQLATIFPPEDLTMEYEEIWHFRTKRFYVALEVAPEYDDPADSFEFPEDVEFARSGDPAHWFQARVAVYLDDEEIAADYLGGCSYLSFEQFYTSHHDPNPENRNTLAMKARGVCICHYFPDMVREAIREARDALRAARPYIRPSA